MIKEEQKLSEKILDYLHKHPGAGDTLEGITSWWLDMDTNEPSIEKVNHALEILVKKGHIRKRQLHGGDVLYKKGRRSVGKQKIVGNWQLTVGKKRRRKAVWRRLIFFSFLCPLQLKKERLQKRNHGIIITS